MTTRPHRDGPWSRAWSHLRSEGGFSAGAEVILVGSLIFVVTWVIGINSWNLLTADMAVQAAAKEGARAFVEAQPGSEHAAATTAVTNAATAMDRPTIELRELSGNLVRCERITVTTGVSIDLLMAPFIQWSPGTVDVSDVHSEVVDPFRSGLPGTAGCA